MIACGLDGEAYGEADGEGPIDGGFPGMGRGDRHTVLWSFQLSCNLSPDGCRGKANAGARGNGRWSDMDLFLDRSMFGLSVGLEMSQ